MKYIAKNICLLTLSLGMFGLAIAEPRLDDLDLETSSFPWGV